MLTKNQKIDIINSRVNVLESDIYNLDLALLEEESKSEPFQEQIDQINIQKSDSQAALIAITNKLNSLDSDQQ